MKKKIKNIIKRTLRISATITTSLALLYIVAFAGVYHKLFLRNVQGRHVVAIYSPTLRGMGTGYHVYTKSGKIMTMTNAHVCALATDDKVLVKSNASKDIKGELRKVIYVDKVHDLCLVSSTATSALKLASSKALVGDRIYVIGHPRGLPKQMQEGEKVGSTSIRMLKKVKIEDLKNNIIDSFKKKKKKKKKKEDKEKPIKIKPKYIYVLKEFMTLHMNMSAHPGNSGSPILNMYGNVVGTLFAGQPGMFTNTFAVPYDHVKRVLDLF